MPALPEVDFDHISIQEGRLVTFLAGGTDGWCLLIIALYDRSADMT